MAKIPQRVFSYATIIVLVLGGLFFGYRFYQVQQEKNDFAKAEQQIDSLASQIEAQIGKPDVAKTKNSCRYSSLKYSEGTLSCTSRHFLLYKNTDLARVNGLLKGASSLSEKPLRPVSGKIKDSFLPTEEGSGYQLFEQETELDTRLSCNVEYLYPGASYLDNPIQPIEGNNLLIIISCSGSASKEYYQTN